MKVKLLKKIRKRFEIIHYPTQYKSSCSLFKGNSMILYDKKEEYCKEGIEIGTHHQRYFNAYCNSESGAKQYLLDRLLKIIQKEYYQYSVKNKKHKPIKIWYNK